MATSSVCQICTKAIVRVDCAGCGCRYYCSFECKNRDAAHTTEACHKLRDMQPTHIDVNHAKETAHRFLRHNMQTIRNDLGMWPLSRSARCLRVVDVVHIFVVDISDVTSSFAVSIGPCPEELEPNLIWPNIDCAISVPVVMIDNTSNGRMLAKFNL